MKEPGTDVRRRGGEEVDKALRRVADRTAWGHTPERRKGYVWDGGTQHSVESIQLVLDPPRGVFRFTLGRGLTAA
jgi:hypothetical protein